MMTDSQAGKKGHKALPLIVIIILIAGGLLVWSLSMDEPVDSTQLPETLPEVLTDTSSGQTGEKAPVISEDEEAVKAVFALVQNAIERHNRAMLERAMSEDSKALFYKDFRFGRNLHQLHKEDIKVSGEIARVQVQEVTRQGETRDAEYIFVKEKGRWWLDLGRMQMQN